MDGNCIVIGICKMLSYIDSRYGIIAYLQNLKRILMWQFCLLSKSHYPYTKDTTQLCHHCVASQLGYVESFLFDGRHGVKACKINEQMNKTSEIDEQVKDNSS